MDRNTDPFSRSRVLVIVPVVVYALVNAMSARSSGLFSDFRILYTGGGFFRDGDGASAYEADRFVERLASEHDAGIDPESTISHFISSPPFGWAMQAFSWMPFDLSLVAWLALSFAAGVAAVRLLRLPLWVAAIIWLAPAGIANLRIGQTGMFVLLAIAAVHHFSSKGRFVAAGLLAGFLIFKPTLALGFALWWLVQLKRWYPAIVAAVASAVVVSLPTLTGGFELWRGFERALTSRAGLEGVWHQRQVALPEFIKLLLPTEGTAVTVLVWLVALVAAGGVVVVAHRRWGGDPELMSAAAVAVTVMFSPHLLIYDTGLLLVPLAVAWHRGNLGPRGVDLVLALHFGGIGLSMFVVQPQLDAFGWAVSPEFPTTMAALIIAARSIPETVQRSPTPDRYEFAIRRS